MLFNVIFADCIVYCDLCLSVFFNCESLYLDLCVVASSFCADSLICNAAKLNVYIIGNEMLCLPPIIL